MLTGPRLQAALIQILVAGFSSIPRMTLALVWPDAFAMFALWLTYRLTVSPGLASPAPAAVNPAAIAAQADGGH